MSINTDIEWYYSGGASGVAATSLGGAKSVNEIVSSTNENLFRNIDAPETLGLQYYCIYLKNNGELTHTNFGIYISTPTPSIDTQVYVGIGTSPVDGTEQTVANNATEPTGVPWTQRYFDYNALVVATLEPGEHKAIWLKLYQLADAGGMDMDYVRLTLVGDVASEPDEDVSLDFSEIINSMYIDLI